MSPESASFHCHRKRAKRHQDDATALSPMSHRALKIQEPPVWGLHPVIKERNSGCVRKKTVSKPPIVAIERSAMITKFVELIEISAMKILILIEQILSTVILAPLV